MRPLPAPDIPGSTDAERFGNAVRRFFSVSKADLIKAEGERKKRPERKKRKKT